MAGTIVADTLQDGAGNSTSMDNAIYGSAKAWVSFTGAGSTSIQASYNVSSVTFVGTGRYTVNLTNALVDAKGSALACGTSNGTVNGQNRWLGCYVASASAIYLASDNSVGSAGNEDYCYFAIFR